MFPYNTIHKGWEVKIIVIKKILIAWLLIALTGCYFNPEETTKEVVIIGDSGFAAGNPSGALIIALAEKSGVYYHNYAQTGASIAGINQQFDRVIQDSELEGHTVKTIVMNGGANNVSSRCISDSERDLSDECKYIIEQTADELRSIYTRILNPENPEIENVIFMGISYISGPTEVSEFSGVDPEVVDYYVEQTSAACAEFEGCFFVDTRGAWSLGLASGDVCGYTVDGAHLSKAGATKIASVLWNQLVHLRDDTDVYVGSDLSEVSVGDPDKCLYLWSWGLFEW